MVSVAIPGPGIELRPLTREEYARLVDLGFFDEDDRIELLEGALVAVSPQKPAHAEVVEELAGASMLRWAPRPRAVPVPLRSDGPLRARARHRRGPS